MDWPIIGPLGRGYQVGGGVNVAAHASNNTKGNYAQFVASTLVPIGLLILQFDIGTVTRDYLVDLAIGGAGSEQIIINNLIYSTNSQATKESSPLWLPIDIPKATRIAMRCQSTTGSSSSYASIQYFSSGYNRSPFQSKLDTYGAATADSGGTSIDPGAVAWTWSAWTQLAAATTRNHKGIYLGFGNQINTTRTDGAWLIDVGIGGAGSEVVIIPSILVGMGGVNSVPDPLFTCFYPINIPAGTRLSVRVQSGITDATDRPLDIVAYCL